MFTYTTKFKQECKRYKIDGNHRAIADLILLGWTPKDAYMAVGLYDATYSDTFHEGMIREITENEAFKMYVSKTERKKELDVEKKLKAKVNGGEEEDTDDASKKYRTKDEVIEALASTVDTLHGKDRADVLMKLADLQRMKQEEVVEEDNTVHFYLPVTCHMCDLYNKEKKRLERLRRKPGQPEEESEE